MYVLPTMHNPPPTEGNFCDEDGKALKTQIIQDYNKNMGLDKGDNDKQLRNPTVDMEVVQETLFHFLT
jgi:hypothetical protein